jgi:hypothetical protein
MPTIGMVADRISFSTNARLPPLGIKNEMKMTAGDNQRRIRSQLTLNRKR